MHARLTSVDPQGARTVRPSDPARIVRALEVYEATGRPLGAWQQQNATPPLVDGRATVRVVLAPDQATLHHRISARADALAAAGAVQEVAALLDLGLDPELPAMKAIGVREFGAHLKGDLSIDEAVAAVKTETRRYARRQMTWFRGQMGDWQWLTDGAALDLAAATA
jgi:tRNA dimethylallyltransferase